MDGPVEGGTQLRLDSRTFGLDSRSIGRLFVATGRSFRQVLLLLLDDLAAGRLNVSGFTFRANRALREAYQTIFSLGALSIDPFHVLTDSDVEVLQREIIEEQRFLKAFAKEIGSGFYVLDPTIRSKLYLYSLRGVFELGRLHAMPSGPYEWVLGDTHHCEPCLVAAFEGPYQLNRYQHLGLPILPGIPGSGDLCLGLTRCGCKIRKTGIPLPNEELQDQMRGLLEEVVSGRD